MKKTFQRVLLATVVGFAASCLFAQSTQSSAQVASASLRGATTESNHGADVATPTAVGKIQNDAFIIGVDDVLAINVWKEPDVSRNVPVRSDGKISLPLAGEITAAGETPKKLEAEIASRLQNYISEPEVTVIVQEIKSQKINILGQVVKPGSYPLTNTMTVLDAIALAGGFRDFAKQKGIYVLRANADGTQKRLAFNYKDVIKGRNPGQNVTLEPRDTVVIP